MTPPTDDFERRLRASLDRHAREAPPGAPLAERILLEVDAPVLRPRRGWRVWSSPLLAAAAIVAAALAPVGLGNEHHDSATAPAATHAASNAATPSQTPAPEHRHSRPTPTSTPTASPTSFSLTVRAVPTAGVRGFRAIDISFDNATEGWALGSARCLTGTGRCTEILHTTDGANWKAAPNGESFNVPGVQGCAEPCVEHVRFANSAVGYAYGANALFMTTDGGAHWTRQAGLGADLLETVGGNVILVQGRGYATPLFRRSAVGSSTWAPFTVPGFNGLPLGGTVQLARAYGATLLTITAYSSAKPTTESGALFRSTDGGATWEQLPSPCGPIGRRSIASATVSAGDGSMVADCALQSSGNPVGLGSTVDAAAGSTRFTRPRYSGSVVAPAWILAAPSRHVQLVVTTDGTVYRSTDAGASWTGVGQPSGVTFLGFHSGTDGRAIGAGGRALWTTSDGGRTWSEALFPR